MRIFFIAVIASIALPLMAGDTPAPAGASVYFIAPADGAKLKSPVRVVFGLSGMGVAPGHTKRQDRPSPLDYRRRPAAGR